MAFRCVLPPQVDKGLELLASAYRLSKQDMVRELVIAAVADEPKIRALVIEDFKAKLQQQPPDLLAATEEITPGWSCRPHNRV